MAHQWRKSARSFLIQPEVLVIRQRWPLCTLSGVLRATREGDERLSDGDQWLRDAQKRMCKQIDAVVSNQIPSSLE
jgi:hypothetical protein